MKNGWKVSNPYAIPKRQADVDDMVALLNSRPRTPIKHVPQHASALANLEHHKDPFYKRNWDEPLPEAAIAVPGAKTIDEAVARRNIDPQDIELHRLTQRHPDRNSLGSSNDDGSTLEAKDRAIHHFMVTPPAKISEEDHLRIVGLIEIASAAPAIEWKQIPWHRALWRWIFGHEVKSETKPPKGWQDV